MRRTMRLLGILITAYGDTLPTDNLSLLPVGRRMMRLRFDERLKPSEAAGCHLRVLLLARLHQKAENSLKTLLLFRSLVTEIAARRSEGRSRRPRQISSVYHRVHEGSSLGAF